MKTALVVEDYPGLRNIIARLLARAGFHVTPAGDGAEALGLFARQAFDVIVCDGELPKMSGREVFDALGADVQARFIAFTDSQLFDGAGCRVVLKPEYEELMRVVEQVTEGRDAA